MDPAFNVSIKVQYLILIFITTVRNFVPISLLVTVEMVKYFQAAFIEWDSDLICRTRGVSAAVQ